MQITLLEAVLMVLVAGAAFVIGWFAHLHLGAKIYTIDMVAGDKPALRALASHLAELVDSDED